MPDAIELVVKDHRDAEHLFEQFRQTANYGVARRICNELRVHSDLEEELIYPILHATDRELAEASQQEHQETRYLIERIERMSAGDVGLPGAVEQLQQAVEHHVAEEESQALPKLRREAGDRMDDVGRRFAERKEELLAATGSAGGMGGTIDLRDKTREELYQQARDADIPGRSKMTKEELVHALEGRS